MIGDNIVLNFDVYNASETPSDSFKILVEVQKPNNERDVVKDFLVDKIDSLNKKSFSVQLNTSGYLGNNNFIITIDHENKIPEIFEDNNFIQVPFFVKADTSVPVVNITFDGNDILDGDFVSSTPEIKIELFDSSLLPYNDTSAISISLNDEPVYYINNPAITFQLNSSNPKMIVTYKPDFSSGNYSLKIIARNSTGVIADSSGIERRFVVSDQTQILDVYNYPNPSAGETFFTFKLTQIPDELKIKIYTVAGRLIKEINKSHLLN